MSRFAHPNRALPALLLAGGAFFSPLAARAAEPLVVRVADAIGAPGQPTAIVLRTYASRPVRRGRATATAANFLTAPFGATPLSAVTSVEVFGGEDDITVTNVTFNGSTGVITADFESTSATINTADGVLAVIHAVVGPGASPGACWPVTLSAAPGASFLNDPDDDGMTLQFRNGEICIRALAADREFEVDGGKVHPGATAVIELGTAEPYAIESGRIVLDYDETLLREGWLPYVETDSRHGNVNVTVSHPQPGRIQIDLVSPDDSFNGSVPGDILRILFPTVRDLSLIGTSSALVFQTGAGQSALLGPGAAPLGIAWADDVLEFDSITGIYTDDFETGDYWVWSAAAP